MDNKDIAKEWFKIAEADLSSAEFLQDMQSTPTEIICYHCQQSAEKYLKEFLSSKGEVIKRTHDLVILNKECRKHDEDFETIEEACLMLTDYGVNIRYPFPMDINQTDMKIAIKSAHKIKDYILAKANIRE